MTSVRNGSPLGLEAVGVALRRVRLLGAALLILQVLGNRADAGSTGLSGPLIAVLVAGGFAAVNGVSFFAARRGAHRGRTFATLELVADGLFTALVAALLDRTGAGVLWAVLAIPVLEGALLYRLRGALATWLGVSVFYMGLELWTADGAALLPLAGTLLYRVGIVLLIALPSGYLSEQLLQDIASQQRATEKASRRGELLARVAEASQQVTQLGREVFDAVTSAAAHLGFDVVDVCVLGERGWTVRATHVTSHDGITPRLPDPGTGCDVSPIAIESGQAVSCDIHTADPETRRALLDTALSAMVASPAGEQTEVTAVLRAGLSGSRTLSQYQVESFELLARQAGVALSNDRLIGELHDIRGQLEHQAFHDSLTGLPNRARLLARLEEALADPDAASETAVLFLDLDHFKQVNDSLGHEVGDDLLRTASTRLSACVRPQDIVGRLGGDEFTVIMLGVTSLDDADIVASRICDTLKAPFKVGEHEIVVSTSVGVALGEHGLSAAELMRRADVAMYQSKEHGRATWRHYTPEIDGQALMRLQLESALRASLFREELEVVYQPVIHGERREVVGVEALVRWELPGRGPVSPEEFIPVAEDTGLIIELGRQVLREACRAGRRWTDSVPDRPFKLAVNISPRQLANGRFLEQLDDILASTGFNPWQLVLEMNERVFSEGGRMRDTLDGIRDRGVNLAIDDFGQGHSSMVYLRRFRVDQLKIDKAYVRDGVTHRYDQAIIRAMITLAHDLEMEVVAEGVETEEQLRQLLQLRCDMLQGHLFGGAVEEHEILALLRGAELPPLVAGSAAPSAADDETPVGAKL